MRIRPSLLLVSLLLVASTVAPSARADEDPKVVARDAFVRGAKLVRDAQWAEALEAFEESSRARGHALTSFNIGACHRAMGKYTLARKDFERSLAENEKSGQKELSPALAEETRRAADEVGKLLAHVELELQPEAVAIAVDGRPLEALADEGGHAVLAAGTQPVGPGKPAPKGKFSVLVDPGAHVITVSRRGFADAVRNETLAPGATVAVRLELDRLPASMRVASQPEGGQVLVDGADVGLAPLTISRPAGRYHVTVKHKGFLPFETQAALDPGQSVDVTAKLAEDKPTLTQKWWFWTGAGVVLAGAATATYFLTRPAPERPAVDGGGLGWAVKAP